MIVTPYLNKSSMFNSLRSLGEVKCPVSKNNQGKGIYFTVANFGLPRQIWRCSDIEVNQIQRWSDMRVSTYEGEKIWEWSDMRVNRMTVITYEDDQIWVLSARHKCDEILLSDKRGIRSEHGQIWGYSDMILFRYECDHIWGCSDLRAVRYEGDPICGWANIKATIYDGGVVWGRSDLSLIRYQGGIRYEGVLTWGWSDMRVVRYEVDQTLTAIRLSVIR